LHTSNFVIFIEYYLSLNFFRHFHSNSGEGQRDKWEKFADRQQALNFSDKLLDPAATFAPVAAAPGNFPPRHAIKDAYIHHCQRKFLVCGCFSFLFARLLG